MRTTVDIADPILDEVKRLKEKEEKTRGEVVSELLAVGLATRRASVKKRKAAKFWWPSQAMGPKVDLDDKEALWAIFDAEQGFPHR